MPQGGKGGPGDPGGGVLTDFVESNHEDMKIDDGDFQSQVEDLHIEAYGCRKRQNAEVDDSSLEEMDPEQSGEWTRPTKKKTLAPHPKLLPSSLPSTSASSTASQQESTPPLSRIPPQVFANRYSNNMGGPFLILVQPLAWKPDSPALNPIAVGKILYQTFKKNEVTDVYKSGKQQVTVVLSSAASANRAVSLPELRAKRLQAFIPNVFISCEGRISGIPTDISDAELLQDLNSSCAIISVHRQNRRVHASTNNAKPSLIPSQTIRLVFEGRARPDFVSLYNVRHPVDAWQRPSRICFKCFKFGHVAEQCRGRPKCKRCGGEEHGADDICPNQDSPPCCLNCKGSHLPTDRSCPAYIHEQEIRRIAAEQGISFIEARRLLTCQNASRAFVQTGNLRFPSLPPNTSSASAASSLTSRAFS